MIAVPAELRGVWKRNGLAIDGGQRSEDEQAYWAQSNILFADVRTGSSAQGPTAFAGSTRVDGSAITWTHTISAGALADSDIATFTCDNDRLIETGQIDVGGHVISFQEWWEKTTSLDAPVAYTARTDSGDSGIAIVGREHAVIVIDDHGSVTGWVLGASDDTWTVITATVAGIAAPMPTVSGIHCPRSWPWEHVQVEVAH
jgi:hypothetical protein